VDRCDGINSGVGKKKERVLTGVGLHVSSRDEEGKRKERESKHVRDRELDQPTKDTSSVRREKEAGERRMREKRFARRPFSFYLSPFIDRQRGQCDDCPRKPWFDRKGNPIRSYPRLDPRSQGQNQFSSKPNCVGNHVDKKEISHRLIGHSGRARLPSLADQNDRTTSRDFPSYIIVLADAP